jgi:DNA-binding response OmpR family regulator
LEGGLRGVRVLLVEDEALLSLLIEESMERLGCDIVGVAACLGDALIKARSLMVDVAILDVNLDGQLSYPVAEILRSRSIPLIFVTGYEAKSLQGQWQDCFCLQKPLRRRALADALNAALRNKGDFPSENSLHLQRTMNT